MIYLVLYVLLMSFIDTKTELVIMVAKAGARNKGQTR